MDPPEPEPLVTFEEFYEAKYRPLLAAVMSVGATLDDAHDAVAEVMEEILTKDLWGTLRNPFAWTRRAVLRTYYDRRVRDREGIKRAVKGDYLVTETDACLDIGLNVWEDTQWVKLMLDALTPTQREVVQNVLAEFTTAEIAELLGKNAATIRQNLALARRQLHAQLNEEYEVPEKLRRLSSTPRKEDIK